MSEATLKIPTRQPDAPREPAQHTPERLAWLAGASAPQAYAVVLGLVTPPPSPLPQELAPQTMDQKGADPAPAAITHLA